MNRQTTNSAKSFRFRRFARKSFSVFNSLHKVVTIGVLAGSTLTSAHAALANPTEAIRLEMPADTIAPLNWMR